MNEQQLKLEQAVTALERAERSLIREFGIGGLYLTLASNAKAHAMNGQPRNAAAALRKIEACHAAEDVTEAELLLTSIVEKLDVDEARKAREAA